MQSITGHAALANTQQTQQQALADASRSLWLATISLMTAFMHNAAPAHRYLLARRIARNFETLQEQHCFPADTRATFSKLAKRWQKKAERLSPNGVPETGVFTRLQRLFAR